MLTYQVRPRIYRHAADTSLEFPSDVQVDFFLKPLQPFGCEVSGGRTAVRSRAAGVLFDSNTGRHWVESKPPLDPLEVVIEEADRRISLLGGRLRIEEHCESLKDLDDLVEPVYFGFPILLSIEFADPVYVERVAGKVGEVPFSWELEYWQLHIHTTTQDLQETRVVDSWERFDVLSKQGNRRVAAALHYFHAACRLARAGNTPWEFMSECILNFSKILEVLFPPEGGDGQTIDAARAGLSGLGVPERNIEGHFIPAMCLRNQIDSAHVDLSLFTRTQLSTLHAYTQVAEDAFRGLLSEVVAKSQRGEFVPAHCREAGARPEAIASIERIAQHCLSVEDLCKDASGEMMAVRVDRS